MEYIEISKLASAYERLHNDYQYLLYQYECLQNELTHTAEQKDLQIEALKEQRQYWETQYTRQSDLNDALRETHNALQAKYLRIEARNDTFEYVLRQNSTFGKYLALKNLQKGKLKQEAE